MTLDRANIARVLGAHRVRDFLRFEKEPGGRLNGPAFQIFKTCPYTIDCLTRMVHDPAHIEDVLKVDAQGGDPLTGDDAYDMVRMALMSRPALWLPSPPAPKRDTEAWREKEARDLEEAAIAELERRKKEADPWGDDWD